MYFKLKKKFNELIQISNKNNKNCFLIIYKNHSKSCFFPKIIIKLYIENLNQICLI